MRLTPIGYAVATPGEKVAINDWFRGRVGVVLREVTAVSPGPTGKTWRVNGYCYDEAGRLFLDSDREVAIWERLVFAERPFPWPARVL